MAWWWDVPHQLFNHGCDLDTQRFPSRPGLYILPFQRAMSRLRSLLHVSNRGIMQLLSVFLPSICPHHPHPQEAVHEQALQAQREEHAAQVAHLRADYEARARELAANYDRRTEVSHRGAADRCLWDVGVDDATAGTADIPSSGAAQRGNPAGARVYRHARCSSSSHLVLTVFVSTSASLVRTCRIKGYPCRCQRCQ